MTSTHNVLTTKLRDLLYNQCIGNTCCYSFLFFVCFFLYLFFFLHFFYLSTGWIKVCKIRFVSTGENAENLVRYARKAVPSLKVGMVSRLIVRKLRLSIQLTIQTWIERTIVFITYPIKRV